MTPALNGRPSWENANAAIAPIQASVGSVDPYAPGDDQVQRFVDIGELVTDSLIRERFGPRLGLLALAGSVAVTSLAFTVELGGVSPSLELATSVNDHLWIPVVGLALWRVKFNIMENDFRLVGPA